MANKVYEYEFPMAGTPTTIVPVFEGPQGLMVVLGIRGRHVDTFPGETCLPGGFLNVGTETIEQAAVRELEEEMSLFIDTNDLQLFAVFSGIDDDPRYHVVNTCFWVKITEEQAKAAVPGDDIEFLKIVPVDGFNEELAFNHNEIFKSFLKNQENKR